MTTAIQDLLNAFDRLPETEKREVASEILRRTAQLDVPSLSDEELILSAEDVFLRLDKIESEDA